MRQQGAQRASRARRCARHPRRHPRARNSRAHLVVLQKRAAGALGVVGLREAPLEIHPQWEARVDPPAPVEVHHGLCAVRARVPSPPQPQMRPASRGAGTRLPAPRGRSRTARARGRAPRSLGREGPAPLSATRRSREGARAGGAGCAPPRSGRPKNLLAQNCCLQSDRATNTNLKHSLAHAIGINMT